jgi:hypothetical protein
LHKSAVQIIHGSSSLEPILQQIELASFASRGQSSFGKQTPSTVDEIYQSNGSEDFLKILRVEDHKWITARFPEVSTFQNSKDGTVFWQWPIQTSYGKLHFRYYHPPSATKPSIARIRVGIGNQDTTMYSEEFPLDKHRFKSIERFVEMVEKSMEISETTQ